jgi:hypothetical protein
MKARVSHLHKTEADWLKLKHWVPTAGEFVIYDPDAQYSYARLKVGDGETALHKLPFFIDSATIALIQKQHYFDTIDAGRVTDYKK